MSSKFELFEQAVGYFAWFTLLIIVGVACLAVWLFAIAGLYKLVS